MAKERGRMVWEDGLEGVSATKQAGSLESCNRVSRSA